MLRILVFWALIVAKISAFQLPEILTDFNENNQLLSELSDSIATRFEREYANYYATGVESPELRELSRSLATVHSNNIITTPIDELGVGDQFFICTTCRATVNVVARMFRDPSGELNGPNKEEDAKAVVLDICRRLNFQSEEVCAGFFDFNWPVADFIIQNSIIDSRSMCGSLPISFCQVKQEEFDWSLEIDQNGPTESGAKANPPQKSADDLSLLHLTDIHYDPLYKAGALADCGEFLCCQRENTVGSSKAAGYWSDYRVCDSPWYMITEALKHIRRTHKIDFIYHTGDIIDHKIWGTSKEDNNAAITKFHNLLEEVFPGVPFYSSVGNHEPHPLNVFGPPDAPEELNVKWLYRHLYNVWHKWLPASAEDTVMNGGYYTVVPKEGFRIISLNNNDCYIFNWWIYYNGSSVRPQLEWLHQTLLTAEKAGENVHILAHIPSGHGHCWRVWSREFNRIVARFHHIISGIFNGHTHVDEFNVHYNPKGHAIGVSWNGGSLTSYSYKNPNYKKYIVSAKTMEIVDFETWIFDLNEANKYGAERSPNWFREYTFSSDFTDDLSPAGIDTLLEKMADNPKLLRKYWRYLNTLAEPRIAGGCDNKCLSKLICRLSTTVSDQKTRCKELQRRLEVGLATEDPDDEDDAAPHLKTIHKQIFFGFLLLLLFVFN